MHTVIGSLRLAWRLGDAGMAEIRRLRMALLERHRRTGEILAAAKLLRNVNFDTLLQQNHISAGEASRCIDLFMRWELVIAAEEWSHDQGWLAPENPKEALSRITRWKRSHKIN